MDDKSALFVNSKTACSCPLCCERTEVRGVFRTSALPPKADIETQPTNVRFVPKADISQLAVVQIDNNIELGGLFDWKFGRLRVAQDLPGLLAWHIILVLAQPRRKRDPDSPMGEPPALGQIVEDHFGGVIVGDS